METRISLFKKKVTYVTPLLIKLSILSCGVPNDMKVAKVILIVKEIVNLQIKIV